MRALYNLYVTFKQRQAIKRKQKEKEARWQHYFKTGEWE